MERFTIQSLDMVNMLSGTDIPEGTYEVTLQSGYGSFQTEDPDNSIYLYGYFSENASDEDEDITEMEDEIV